MGRMSQHKSNLPRPLPPFIWANELTSDGLCSDKPVRVSLCEDINPNTFDPDSDAFPYPPRIYASEHRAANHVLRIACYGQDTFGLGVSFSSESYKEVMAWTEGVLAAKHLLQKLMTVQNNPIGDKKKHGGWKRSNAGLCTTKKPRRKRKHG